MHVDRECEVSLIIPSHISRRSLDLLLSYMIRLVPSLFRKREDLYTHIPDIQSLDKSRRVSLSRILTLSCHLGVEHIQYVVSKELSLLVEL